MHHECEGKFHTRVSYLFHTSGTIFVNGGPSDFRQMLFGSFAVRGMLYIHRLLSGLDNIILFDFSPGA